jgi:hypothetical protein
MSGDSIHTLPTTPTREAKPSELEIVHALFNNRENYPIIKAVISPFKSAFLGALLFGLLSLPPIMALSDVMFKNVVVSRLVLMLVFLVAFFILTRVFK